MTKNICPQLSNSSKLPQLFLRIALAIGYASPVFDRLGIFGTPGSNDSVFWGNMGNFLDYTHTLLPIFSRSVSDILGITATIAETLFATLLLVGYKVKITALGSALLSLVFALSMTIFLHPTAAISYSVFTVSAASLLLSTLPTHSWSLDSYLSERKSQRGK